MRNIAVVMGGYSDESVISLKSGQLILNHLDKTKYHIYEVHILSDSWNVLYNAKNSISIVKIFQLLLMTKNNF